MTAERRRLEEAGRREAHWHRWGPYLSERAWGTVREDYSPYGTAWEYLPHDHARSKAYRWGEDGIAGFSDNHQRLCLAFAFWNGKDPILKERLFGLTGNEGNHAEDVKEYYYYLDATPTYSYAKCLYKYPQNAYPYHDLVTENRRRGKFDWEYELMDTGVFNEDRYFDIFVEYAKASVDDLLARVTVCNRGPQDWLLHVLPTLWFRNTWAWGRDSRKPRIRRLDENTVLAEHYSLGAFHFWQQNCPRMLFTENETNTRRLYNDANGPRFYKDAFHECVIGGREEALRQDNEGTKMAGWHQLHVPAGGEAQIRLRLSRELGYVDFDEVFRQRMAEADEFYGFFPQSLPEDARMVQRQALAGLLWSKQYYHFVIEEWLEGDPAMPSPPPQRKNGRNSSWFHLYTDDVLTMPDKWEYPWFAAWDTAFHMIPYALVDPEMAKHELQRFLREWYLHPNGQIPAYEWAFDDVNPPVHAWACWRVYKIDGKLRGEKDVRFLESVFHKLLMNFTWWVNRKDSSGDNIFEGGFLGLDNIGLFDRSKPLPGVGRLEQSDGTSWMAMYCLNMLRIALELAQHNPVYEDIASKFFEHFLYIAHAMNTLGGSGLWDEQDGFYYDRVHFEDGATLPLKVRSLVGLIPLFAVDTMEPELLEKLSGFRRRMEWFMWNRPDLRANIASTMIEGVHHRRLLAICHGMRLIRVLKTMLDEDEFLSPFGLRSLSRFHRDNPVVKHINGEELRVAYDPAESTTGLFGGNSNWRGPVWFPVNYLMIESLQKYNHYYGDQLQVEFPTGSGNYMNLGQVAAELSKRLARLFVRDESGRRPVFGGNEKMQNDPHWRDYILFYEYFHGDNGAGLGASHQTGWTSLVAKLIQQSGV